MMPDLSTWGARLDAAVCEKCDWSYLLPAGSPPQRCPHCYQTTLTPIEESFEQLAYTQPPELVIKAAVTQESVAAQIQKFAKGIPFSPKDLTPENLAARLRYTYIPLWLVDGQVQATWQAEMGFDYQVVSHREKYDAGSWNTEQVKETRIRWEPRLGRLNRSYHNRHAPALEEEPLLEKQLGTYKLDKAEPYRPDALSQTFIRLPNRPPQDAWPAAEPAFLAAGTDECRQASEADHIRDFRWSPHFHNRNWTQLLRSAYTTYYLDDDNRPHPVLINGQSGYISGSRRASMHRARRMTLVILIIAVFIFFLGTTLAAAGFFFEATILSIGVAALTISLIVAFISLLPVAVAWNFNRQQPGTNSVLKIATN
jgi:hypothetical protein